jgi:hypothetical protein
MYLNHGLTLHPYIQEPQQQEYGGHHIKHFEQIVQRDGKRRISDIGSTKSNTMFKTNNAKKKR